MTGGLVIEMFDRSMTSIGNGDHLFLFTSSCDCPITVEFFRGKILEWNFAFSRGKYSVTNTFVVGEEGILISVMPNESRKLNSSEKETKGGIFYL